MATTLLLSHGATNTRSASDTRYYMICGNVLSTTTESARTNTFRSGGVLSNLYINILTNSISANSTFRTRKATANGAQSVSITASTTGKFEDTSNTDTVTAGDDWHAQIVCGGTGTTLTFQSFSVLFAATTNTVMRYGGLERTYSAASTTYIGSFGGAGDFQAGGADSDIGVTYQTSGTLANLLFWSSSNARTNTTTFRSRVNSANGNLVVSITASGTGAFEDTSNSDTINSGDLVAYSLVTGTGTESLVSGTFAVEFTTTNGQQMYNATDGSTMGSDADTTLYFGFTSELSDFQTTESKVQVESNLLFTASKMQIFITANTVLAASTLTLRKNTAAGNQTISIPGLTGTGLLQDLANTDSIAATDVIDYQIVGGAGGTDLRITSICVLGDSSVATSYISRLALLGAG